MESKRCSLFFASARMIALRIDSGSAAPFGVASIAFGAAVMCSVAHSNAVFASNGQRAGEHLVRHHGERVDVAARIERLARELLRAHVRRRAEHHALLRELGLVAILLAASLRDAEVEDLHEVLLPGALGEDDVVRLEIAMDDPLAVRLGERAADLRDDLLDARGRDRAVLLEDVRDAPALHELHDDEEDGRRPSCRSRRPGRCSGARASASVPTSRWKRARIVSSRERCACSVLIATLRVFAPSVCSPT